MRTSKDSPPSIRFTNAGPKPEVTLSLLPVARSNSGPIFSKTVAPARAVNTFISAPFVWTPVATSNPSAIPVSLPKISSRWLDKRHDNLRCFGSTWKTGRVLEKLHFTACAECPSRTSCPEEFFSPPGAPKTVREPLDSHGSRCSTVGRRATGFTLSAGSSCCQMASVGRRFRLNNATPSVQLDYRAFVPTTGHSAPVLRIGTLVLAVLAACDFSLYIGAQVLTFRTRARLSFTPPTCRMPLGAFRHLPELISEAGSPPGFDIV